MEYAERLLDYFKNARVLAPTDSKLASIEQKLDSILPYVTSKLYELEEVAEPEDPELAGLPRNDLSQNNRTREVTTGLFSLNS